ncbi:MAG: peptidoglycan DD-metalloendopeptidase family protein [Anaerolineales bacterium]|nr:MAG: peptidoglycan DD-metalloendopeptidase family protein [Anaerolineales bacterium]
MHLKSPVRIFVFLFILFSAIPVGALALAAAPPDDMFQLPWEQGRAWVAYDGLDNGTKRPKTSPHYYGLGGAIDFAPRVTMRVGEDTSNDWVTAAAAGTVSQAGYCWVKIDHGNGWTTEYWHLGNIQVTQGDKVSRNQRLAVIHNNSGEQVCLGNEHPGPHLHFVVRPSVMGTLFAGWKVNFNSFTNITTYSKGGQTVGRLQPLMNIPNLQIAFRGPITWDTQYSGSVDAYRHERWSLILNEQTTFTITVAPAGAGLVPVILLLNGDGAEISRGHGTLHSTRPAGSYFVQVQSELGTGYYNLIATRESAPGATPTPGMTETPVITAPPSITSTSIVTPTDGTETPLVSETPSGSETPVVTVSPGTPDGTETPLVSETPSGSETPVVTVSPGTPDGTETPLVSETPSGSETPIVTVSPGTPDGTETPLVSETPSGSETPIVTLTPTGTIIATSTSVTAIVTETSVATGTPVITDTLELTSTVTATPIFTPTAITTPSGPYVWTDVLQSILSIGESSSVTVGLFNVPAEGYTSAEFICTYDPAVVEVSNILVTSLFGTDPVSALNGPQFGQFILAVAGSDGKRATTSGTVFTFMVQGLQAGQTPVQCTARVSEGQGTLESIEYIPDNVTVIGVGASPTGVVPTTAIVNGQVFASKPITIELFDSGNQLVLSETANLDGTFSLPVSAGTYAIIASAPGFLNAQGSITLMNGVVTTMPTVSLPAGDIDGNGVIDQFDALTIGMSYNASLPAEADLNNDGVIDFLDLELLAFNYNASGALAWQ